MLRKEKKVLKKQRQKVEKADIGSVKPLDKPNKDQNENFFDNVIETVQDNSFLDVVQSQSVQGCLPHDTHASTGSSSPVKRPPTPITPMTPYTPPGPPPCSSLTPVVTTEQPGTHLSTYFENSATTTDLIDEALDREQVNMKEYIENISKISLIPLRRKEERI